VARKKKILVWAGLAGVAAAAAAWLASEPPAPAHPRAGAPSSNVTEAKAASGSFTVPSREGLSRPRGELFASPAPARPAAKPQAQVEAAVVAAPPAPPAVPYRVAGQVVHEGPPRIVLARDERVFFVAEGDMLEGGYRVESIRADGVTLLYTALDARQHLPAASALGLESAPGVAAAKPAPLPPAAAQGRPVQLRWEGPTSVQAGSEFEVALKMTSDRPVRGSPLQLSYDAKVLEPVAVRAGEFFAEGSFTYRVNAGSIFVGAFGRGEVAADAEFVVVTFKPIRPGAMAELSLSSLVLQGASGALVHEPLAAFRTAISK
jgi:hypothetical protein